MRLIDADKLIKEAYPLESIPLERVKNEPTVMTGEVRHGKWIDIFKNFETAECSYCHSQFEVSDNESNEALWDGFKQFYNFCPNCGAKMDLE